MTTEHSASFSRFSPYSFLYFCFINKGGRRCSLYIFKDGVAVLNDELDGNVLGVHVGHFALDAEVAHNGRRKDDGKVLGGHLQSVSQLGTQETDE